jgi:hypothetical protein
MANDDFSSARGGLRPSMQPYGTVKRSYYKLTTSATADVYIGQPVDLDGSGQVTAATVGTANGIFLVGAVLGFARDSRGQHGLPNEMSLITQGAYLPKNVDAFVCVSDDPNQEYIMQEGSTAVSALALTNIGQTVGFSFAKATSGDTVTGSSLAEITPVGAAASTMGSLRLVALADQMNSDGSNNAVGTYAKWRVRIQNHRLASQLPTSVI